MGDAFEASHGELVGLLQQRLAHGKRQAVNRKLRGSSFRSVVVNSSNSGERPTVSGRDLPASEAASGIAACYAAPAGITSGLALSPRRSDLQRPSEACEQNLGGGVRAESADAETA